MQTPNVFGEPTLAAEGCARFGLPQNLFSSEQGYGAQSRTTAEWQTMRTTLKMGWRLLSLTSSRDCDLIVCGGVYSSAVLTYLVSRIRRVSFIIYSHGEDVTIVGDSWWKKVALNEPFGRQNSPLRIVSSRTANRFERVEGFGMVYLEAGAAGRPSVAGDQGGAPMTNAERRWVRPRNVERLTSSTSRCSWIGSKKYVHSTPEYDPSCASNDDLN
jgi:hypothetical protein